MRYLISGSQRAGLDVLDRLARECRGGWSRIVDGMMRGHFQDRDGVMVKVLSERDQLAGLDVSGRLYVLPAGDSWASLLERAVERGRGRVELEYFEPPRSYPTLLVRGEYAPRNEGATFLAEDPATGDWLKVRPLNNPDLHVRTVLHEPSLRCFVPNRWMPIPA